MTVDQVVSATLRGARQHSGRLLTLTLVSLGAQLAVLLTHGTLALDLHDLGRLLDSRDPLVVGLGILVGAVMVVGLAPVVGRAPPGGLRSAKWDRLGGVLVIEMLTTIAVAAGRAVFVIPGAVLGVLLLLASPLALERPLVAALRDSVRLGWRHFGLILGTLVVLALVAALGVLVLIGGPAFALGSSHPVTLGCTLVLSAAIIPVMTLGQLILARELAPSPSVAPEALAAFD